MLVLLVPRGGGIGASLFMSSRILGELYVDGD